MLVGGIRRVEAVAAVRIEGQPRHRRVERVAERRRLAIVGVAVVGRHRAGDHRAVLGRRGGVRNRNRRIVRARDGDRQGRRRSRPSRILHRVAKNILPKLTLREAVGIAVRIIECVRIPAIGGDHHRTILADNHLADISGHTIDSRYGLGVAGIDIGVVGENIADCRRIALKGRVARVHPGLDHGIVGIGISHGNGAVIGSGKLHSCGRPTQRPVAKPNRVGEGIG